MENDLFAPRLASFLRCETMNCGGHAGAAPKRIFQVYRPAMFFQKIAKSLVGELLKVLHLIAAEKIDLSPGLLVELHPLARHQPAFLCRACARAGFLAVRAPARDGVDCDEVRRAPPPPSALTLCRSASMRLITLDGARSFGRSIFSPFCLRRCKSFSASSYWSLNCCGFKCSV